MKTGSIIFFGIIFSINSFFAQTGWFLNHSDTNARYESNFFTDANTGYVVGDKFFPTGFAPIVIKTTNAGGSWSPPQITPMSSAPNWMFRGVFFYDANTGYIAGANLNNPDTGIVLKTTNGGTNWTKLTLPALVHMTNVYFPTSLIGYAIGRGKVFKTTDAGNDWTEQSIPVSTYMFSLQFINAETGWVAGNSGIINSTNGGENWSLQYSSPPTMTMCGVYFINANTGIAVGGSNSSYIIVRTSNGGNLWSLVDSNNSSALLWSVKFVNTNTGWATGWNNNILKTTNGGFNWFNQTPPTNNLYLRTCFFTSANTGYIVGEAGGPGDIGVIYKTTNGGGIDAITPIGNEIPVQFNLHQNFPNPFNPVTNIKFDLPHASEVKLTVFDILGREVEVLVNEFLKPGIYNVDWDASNYPSGAYFYKISADDYTETKKMILVK